jgi:hypothetical protein
MNETNVFIGKLYPIPDLPLFFRTSKFIFILFYFGAKNFQNEKSKILFKNNSFAIFLFFEKNGQILGKKTFLGTFYSDFRLVAF